MAAVFKAAVPFSWFGHSYAADEVIDVSSLPAHAMRELLSQPVYAIDSGSGVTGGVVAKSANYTMAATDGAVLATGTITITLPPAASVAGARRYTVKNVGTGVITVAGGGGTIDGAATFTMSVQYSSVDFACDGTNWYTV